MPKELRAALHEGVRRLARTRGAVRRGAGRVRGISPRAVVPVPGGARSGRRRRDARSPLVRVGTCSRPESERSGRGDVAAAERLLGRAMELLPADDPRALSAMPSMGQALYYRGQLDRALEFLEGASARAADAGADTVIGARSPIHRALVWTHLDPEFAMRSALTEIESLMAPLVAADDDLGLADGWSVVAVLRFWLGDGAGSLEAIDARTPTPSAPDRSGSCGSRPTSCSARSSGDPSRPTKWSDEAGELIAEIEAGERLVRARSVAGGGSCDARRDRPRGRAFRDRPWRAHTNSGSDCISRRLTRISRRARARSIRRDGASRERRHRATP